MNQLTYVQAKTIADQAVPESSRVAYYHLKFEVAGVLSSEVIEKYAQMIKDKKIITFTVDQMEDRAVVWITAPLAQETE